MWNFKAKVHQIRFRLGFTPDADEVACMVFPDPLSGFKVSISTGKEGKMKRLCSSKIL